MLPSAGLLEFRKLYEVPVDFRHVPAACGGEGGGRKGGRNNVLLKTWTHRHDHQLT